MIIIASLCNVLALNGMSRGKSELTDTTTDKLQQNLVNIITMEPLVAQHEVLLRIWL